MSYILYLSWFSSNADEDILILGVQLLLFFILHSFNQDYRVFIYCKRPVV